MITHSKPWIIESDRQAIRNVMDEGYIANGPRVQEFENAVLAFTGSIGGKITTGGTAAIFLALKALGIKEGDEIILPTYVCCSVSDAVSASGGTPVFCDVGLNWNMTAKTIKQKISSKTKAIILVHIFGIPADVPSIADLGVPVIEDVCQAFGASVEGKKLGVFGEFGIYSFHATKCLTTGEGGMIIANSRSMLEKLTKMTNSNTLLTNMTDIQAAIGLSQLSRYDSFLTRRKQISERYFREIDKRFTERLDGAGEGNIFFRFVINSELDFESTRYEFLQNGVHIRRGVDALLHRDFGLPDDDFPNACTLFDRTISLPIYPALTNDEQSSIINVCKKVLIK